MLNKAFQQPDKPKRSFLAVAVLLALGYVIFRGAILVIMPYNLDELGHAHNSWLHTQGWRFIIDDCDIVRPPFLRFLLMPLFFVFEESGLLFHRAAVSLLSYAALLLFFFAIKNSTDSRQVAFYCVLCFALSTPFLMADQQIRYEPFMLFSFGMGLYFFFRAEAKNLDPFSCLVAGFFLSLAVGIKVLIAPYLLSFLLVSALRARGRNPARTLRGAVMLAGGMALPLLLLLAFYRPFLQALAQQTESPAPAITSFLDTITMGMGNITIVRYLIVQPLFWGLGAVSGLLLLTRYRRLLKGSSVVPTMLFGTILYLAVVPTLKKQMYLQDLSLPALSAALLIAVMAERIRGPKARLIKVLVLALLVVEGLASAGYHTLKPMEKIDQSRTRMSRIPEGLEEMGRDPRPGESFVLLYKKLPPYVFNPLSTRREQDAAMRYFRDHTEPADLSLASDSLNVFRKSPHAWSVGLLVIADLGLDHLLTVSTHMPDSIWRVVRCTNAAMLMDTRTSGMGENLVRELEHSRPKVILVDRFMLDLWFEYPDYLRVLDLNYVIRYDPVSRRVFAHRATKTWKDSGLAPLPPWDCDAYDFLH